VLPERRTHLLNDILRNTKKIRNKLAGAEWHINSDICVVGAGISGLSAALEAARAGLKVVLIDNQNQIGGQTYSSYIGTFCGFFTNGPQGYQLTHRIADELFRDLKEAGGLFENPIQPFRVPYYNETLFLRWAEKKVLEAGIQLLLGATVRKVIKEKRRITSLETVTRYGEVSVRADAFVDASGDAVVAWLSGMDCNVPEEGTVFGSIMFLLEGIDYSTPVPTEEEMMQRMSARAEAYGLSRKKGLMFYMPQRGDCGVAYGNMTHVDTPLDPLLASSISISGKDQVDRVLEFLRQEYPANFGAASVRVYANTGIRQTRWISGMHQLSLEDVRSGKRFDDAIARTAWPVELHDHGDGYEWEVFDDNHVHYIPLGSLISPEADNYAACGRCIDADVAALSSVRVMGPCTATGSAAALALVLAGKGSIHSIDIKRLQNMLYDNLDRRD
jgi:hypothetical protein